MKRLVSLILLLTGVLPLSAKPARESMEELTSRVFALAESQYAAIDAALPEGTFPKSVSKDAVTTEEATAWTAGFYPGSLWYIYLYGKDGRIRSLAEKYTRAMEPATRSHISHDLGFQFNCSYGNALRITGDPGWQPVLLEAARLLAGRFNPVTGVTRSWNFSPKGKTWLFPVIIDNMMNLELLTEAARLTGDDSFRDIAVSHARTTIRNHFREDGTCFHVVDYDPETGSVRWRGTHQGYADGSAWARGQGWALYGYTMMYEKTGEAAFLAQAETVARMLLERLPGDGIPYWDFDAPEIPDEHRDASAAAVMCSAFVRLASLTSDRKLSRQCSAMAEKQIRTLASPLYLACVGENAGFLLYHSVGNLPKKSQVDVPLPYADYYFLEALLRWNKIL
ncbi:MAG: glycoside hydrolase family 88 protein [Bacteroidales bacterium]|nr:glycoside hydrolase family 88 protein [Bacteroidales bacterium]